MVNLGKEIENDKKWICFIKNNDFKTDQIILKKKKLKKWPIGYETAK